MNVAGDSADELIKITLQGVEVFARISGSAVKETTAMLYAIAKDSEKNRVGQTNLLNMMKTSQDLEIFSLKKSDLEKFVKESKKYGIKYCTLLDKNEQMDDGIVDILTRKEDMSRINRIVKRYDISVAEVAEVRAEAIKEKEKQAEEIEKEENTENAIDALLAGSEQEETNENVLDDIQFEKDEDGVSENFFIEKNQSENFLLSKGDIENDEKPSVTMVLENCKKEARKQNSKESESKEPKQKGKDKKKKNKFPKKIKGGKKNGRNR